MIFKILKFFFFLLFLITPLVFTSFNSELFEYNKMIFVYALTIVISGLWVMRMVSEKRVIIKRTPLDIPLLLFLASQIISTLLSIDMHTSIWGYYSRSNGGLLSIISYIMLFYAFISNFTKDDILLFLRGIAGSALLTSLYAIPEHFGISPSCVILTNQFTASCWVQDVQARVFGTLGQPNWLAAFLSMAIFPYIFLFISEKRIFFKASRLFGIICTYLAFTFTYSRGATLGLIAGFGIMGLAIALHAYKNKNFIVLKQFAVIGLIFIFINILFGSAITDYRLLKNPAVPLRPDITTQAALPSGTQLENGGTESGAIRLIVWRGALEIFKAYPLFGSGVETFAYSYYQFRPQEHNLVSEWDFLYNKAHNEYLNYLATTGAFGFLTYIAVILTFGLFCFRQLIDKRNKDNLHLVIFVSSIAAGYASYLVQNFFLFSVVAIALLFYLYPAITFIYLDSAKEVSLKNFFINTFSKFFNLVGKNTIPRRIIQTGIVILILLCLNSLYSLWEADTLYKRGSDYNDAGNPGRAYNFLIEAVRLNPNEPLYISELGHAAGSSALALAETEATTSSELKDDAIFFTDLALSQSPVNTTVLRTAIRTFFELTLLDPSVKERTIEVINQSIAFSPTDPKLQHNKGIVLSQLGDIKEATASLEEAIKLKPNYIDARKSLADIYLKNNMKDLAKAQYEAILQLTPGDPEMLKLLEEAKR